MTDFTALNTEAQKLINIEVAIKNSEIASLQAAFDAYKLSHPDVVTPPPPPPPPPPTTGNYPGVNGEGTGATGTLTASGSITANTAGQVIQNKLITGTLTINAANVIVRNCKILGSVGAWGSNVLMEDCTVDGQNKVVDGIFGYGTFRRCNVQNCVNGITVGGSNTMIDFCFISTLGNTTTANPHYDCVAMHGGDAAAGGLKNVTVKNCRFKARDTSGVFIADDFAPIDNVTVDGNYFGGRPSYHVYSVSRHTHVLDVKITNNTCEPTFYSATNWFDIVNSGTTVSGNVAA